MLFLSAEKLVAIAGLCRAYGVKRLELFGSAATDAFRPGSTSPGASTPTRKPHPNTPEIPHKTNTPTSEREASRYHRGA